MVSLWRFYALIVWALLVWGAAGYLISRRVSSYVSRRHAEEPSPAEAPSRSYLWFERTVYALSVLGVVLFAYSFVEPYRPAVVRVTIPAPGLAAGRPIRVVHLSDLHCDPRPRAEPRLPGMVAGLEPDLIVFTGDAVNSDAGLPIFRNCMEELTRIAPVYAVIGNWEAWWFAHLDLYGGTGVRALLDETVSVEVDGRRFHIAGVSVDHEPRIPDVLARVPRESFCLFLHHFPAAAAEASEGGADVLLCGDTHGGQVWLPLLGEMVRIERHGVWMPRGLHRVGEAYVYVNRGIGMEGGSAPRVRFMTRPEVTLVELVPAEGAVR